MITWKWPIPKLCRTRGSTLGWTKTSTEPQSCQADHHAFSSSGSSRDPMGAPKKCSSARLQVFSSCCASEAGRDLMLRSRFFDDVPIKTFIFRGCPIYIMGWMAQLRFHLSQFGRNACESKIGRQHFKGSKWMLCHLYPRRLGIWISSSKSHLWFKWWITELWLRVPKGRPTTKPAWPYWYSLLAANPMNIMNKCLTIISKRMYLSLPLSLYIYTHIHLQIDQYVYINIIKYLYTQLDITIWLYM